jgi:hypothetical protein
VGGVSEQIADGMVKFASDVVHFEMRALAGYVNRWIPCTDVMLRVAPTGEAELVIRHQPAGMELAASDDGVHATAPDGPPAPQ